MAVYDEVAVTTPEARISGTAAISTILNTIADGGGVLGTMALSGFAETGTGGATVGGLSNDSFTYQDTGSGGCIVSGGDLLIVKARGGAEASGEAVVSAIYNYEHQTSEVLLSIPDTVYSTYVPDQPGGVTPNTCQFRLDGSKVIPSDISSDYAFATVSIDDQIVTWNIEVISQSSTITEVLFYGPADVNSSTSTVAIDASNYSNVNAGTISGSASISVDLIDDLRNDLWYLQIETTDFPNGSMRGQVILSNHEAKIQCFYNPMSVYPITQTTGLGGIETGGSAINSLNGNFAYDEVSQGGVVAGGLAEGNFQEIIGGLEAGGAVLDFKSRNEIGDGGAVISGDTIDQLIWVMQGGVVTCCIESDVTNIYNSDVPTGGVNAGGSALSTLNGEAAYDEVSEGGVSVGGSDEHVILTQFETTGGTLAGGSATVITQRDIVPTGGVNAGGEPIVNAIFTIVDGRFQLEESQVVPPSGSTRSGSANFELNSNNLLSWNIQFNGNNVSELTINGPAEIGETGPTSIDLLPYTSNSSPSIGSLVLTIGEAAVVRDNLSYVELGSGSTEVRGQIYLDTTGAVTSGVASVPIIGVVEGGAVVGGEALAEFGADIPGEGGVEVGGSAEKLGLVLPPISGGAVISGSAIVDAIYNPVGTGGAEAGGLVPPYVFIFAKGGVEVGGETTGLKVILPEISGGAVVSGTPIIVDFYLSKKVSGGAKVGGRARVVGVVTLESFTTGVGRTLTSFNLIKEIEAELLDLDPELTQIIDDFTPESDVDTNSGEYCDVIVRCSEGVLPDIVQNRQGEEYLPDGKITVRDR